MVQGLVIQTRAKSRIEVCWSARQTAFRERRFAVEIEKDAASRTKSRKERKRRIIAEEKEATRAIIFTKRTGRVIKSRNFSSLGARRPRSLGQKPRKETDK